MPKSKVSVIVPALNEEVAVLRFYEVVSEALGKSGVDWEIVLVDDGSTDRTAHAWQQLMAVDQHLGLIRLSRNFGKEAALLAGMAHATGDAVIPMDVDLQDPPELLSKFVEKWHEGYEQVVGRRASRDDPAWKSATASAYYWTLHRITRIRIPQNVGDFRLIDRKIVDRLLALPECDRYTKGLYSLVGGSTTFIDYDRPARSSGRPSQSLTKLIGLALDGITGFSDAPLRLLLPIGVASALFGGLYLAFMLFLKLIGIPQPQGYPTMLSFVLMFGGIQVFALGLIGEYVARIYRESKRRPTYIVDATEGCVSKR
jgi:glycosyltransferase involved in cell wall biosynthesis